MKNLPTFEEFLNEHYQPELELNEALNSEILRGIMPTKKRSGYANIPKKNFFDALSSMGVSASEITDLHITKITPEEGARFAKSNPDAILLYVSETDKENPFSKTRTRIDKNTILGVVKGKFFMTAQFIANEWRLVPLAAAQRQRGRTSTLGIATTDRSQYASGITSISRLVQVSDVVYVIDPANVPSSTDLRKLRRDSRKGAIALKSDKEFKKDNLSRYEEILKERAVNDDIDGLVKSAIETVTNQIKEAALKNIEAKDPKDFKVGVSPDGRPITYSAAASELSRLMDDYSYYVEKSNSYETVKDRHGDEEARWIKSSLLDYAKNVKDRARKIENLDYAW